MLQYSEGKVKVSCVRPHHLGESRVFLKKECEFSGITDVLYHFLRTASLAEVSQRDLLRGRRV